ncbi:hypothetical protein INR49_000386 [Caranx melampygus]|nr:hypothetical protein INR49_000386 [Caranx melampygus]
MRSDQVCRFSHRGEAELRTRKPRRPNDSPTVAVGGCASLGEQTVDWREEALCLLLAPRDVDGGSSLRELESYAPANASGGTSYNTHPARQGHLWERKQHMQTVFTQRDERGKRRSQEDADSLQQQLKERETAFEQLQQEPPDQTREDKNLQDDYSTKFNSLLIHKISRFSQCKHGSVSSCCSSDAAVKVGNKFWIPLLQHEPLPLSGGPTLEPAQDATLLLERDIGDGVLTRTRRGAGQGEVVDDDAAWRKALLFAVAGN